MGSTILRYTQPASMTPMQFADDLYAKSCKVANTYEEATLNDVFIEGVGSFICHSLREFWDTHQHADVIDIAFKAQALVAIQKGSLKAASSDNHATQSKHFARRI